MLSLNWEGLAGPEGEIEDGGDDGLRSRVGCNGVGGAVLGARRLACLVLPLLMRNGFQVTDEWIHTPISSDLLALESLWIHPSLESSAPPPGTD